MKASLAAILIYDEVMSKFFHQWRYGFVKTYLDTKQEQSLDRKNKRKKYDLSHVLSNSLHI